MNKFFKRTIDVVLYILLFIVVIYAVNIFYFRVIKKEQRPRIFNYYIFNIMTGSMENKLHVNDYILVKKTNKVKVNDIITFEKDGSYITHRIVKITNNQIITKGDANNTTDDPITKDVVIGKYVCKLNVFGFIIKNKYIIIAIVAILYIVNLIFNKK